MADHDSTNWPEWSQQTLHGICSMRFQTFVSVRAFTRPNWECCSCSFVFSFTGNKSWGLQLSGPAGGVRGRRIRIVWLNSAGLLCCSASLSFWDFQAQLSAAAMLPPAQTPDQAPAATTPPFGPLCQRSSQPHGLPVHVLTVHGLHALIHPPNHTNNSPSSPLLPSSPVFPVLPLLPMWSALITVSAQSLSTWSASSTAVFVFGLSYFRSRVHYSYKRNWFIITTILGRHQIWKSGFTSKFYQGSYFNLQAWLP